MGAALAHRGPDGAGVHVDADGHAALAHRRLAVIEAGDASAQPMLSDDDRIALVLDGAIYNFRDLRAELLGHGCRFRSRSDAEVLLRGYEVWGDGVLERARGAFAFAIWDGRKRRLLAARDRMGERPLYYALVPGAADRAVRLAVASEPKALCTVPGFDARTSGAAVAAYLAFGHVPPPLSIYAGARKLDAGERLVLDLAPGANAQPDVHRYWTPPVPTSSWRGLVPALPQEEATASRNLWTLLRRAVERQLVGDVPLGVLLSGDVASSAVAAALVSLFGSGRGVATFALGFGATGDAASARAVAQHLGTDHHEHRLDGSALPALLDDMAGWMDEPLGDPSIVPTYALSKFARANVTVSLGGPGGATLLGGRPASATRVAAGLVLDRLPAHLRSQLARLIPMVSSTYELEPGDRLADSVLAALDRAAGAAGLEVRAPFLDQDVVTFANALPPSLRRHGDRLLRRALRDRLPAEFLNRAEPDPTTAVAGWLRGPLRALVNDALARDRLVRDGVLDPDAIERMLREHTTGARDHARALWPLLALELWRDRWGFRRADA